MLCINNKFIELILEYLIKQGSLTFIEKYVCLYWPVPRLHRRVKLKLGFMAEIKDINSKTQFAFMYSDTSLRSNKRLSPAPFAFNRPESIDRPSETAVYLYKKYELFAQQSMQ